MKRIRVLIVDDSLLFRKTLSKGLQQFDGIEVVGTAEDPSEAGEKIPQLKPDVITLDVEMPRMDGIKFLGKLLPVYSVPVIVVSSVNDSVFEAMRAGALDFVGKPQPGESLPGFIDEVYTRIMDISTVELGYRRGSSFIDVPTVGIRGRIAADALIAIGASTGGTEAIYNMLTKFSVNMPGIAIALHMPHGFTKLYAKRLDDSCELSVKEAEDNDELFPGRVLIAPGNLNMTVHKKCDHYAVRCRLSEKVNGHRPSVDVLFDSVAQNANANTMGIILTGMGSDGTKGLKKIREAGGYTVGQDEKTSVVYGMPRAAYNAGAVVKQSPLFKIPDYIVRQFSASHL